MKCEDIRRHFSEYIDLEAPEEIASAIEEHVAACGECRRELESFRKFNAAIASVGEEELPFDFSVTLQANLEEEKKKGRSRSRSKSRPWLRALAACACLMLVLGVFSLGSSLFGLSMGASAAQDAPASAPMAYAMNSPMKFMDMAVTEDAAPMEEYIIAEESAMEAPMGDNGFYDEAEVAEVEMEADIDAAEGGSLKRSAGESTVKRKIIKNYSLSLRVEDFDAAYKRISELASEYGGYVVSGNTSDYEGSIVRDGWLSIRVDAERADEVIDHIAELGTIEHNSFSSNDVTSDYYDTQTRLEQYRAQEERLLELYQRAETIEDLISLESEMTRVIAEIESMEGTLRYYDQLTTLSLIDVNLYTPSTYTQTVEPTGWAGFWENVKSGFLRGINNTLDSIASIFIFFVRILPTLILLAAIAMLLLFFCRRGRRGRKEKLPKKEQE